MTSPPPRKRLKDIESFGAIDADADSLLRSCFQNHEAYLSARDMRRFLILGRKGSGKTAIYKRIITTRAPQDFSFGHTFDDYPWHYHDLQAQVGVPEERRYIHSWRYLVLMGLAKLLLNVDQSQPWSEDAADALALLEAFVVDSYGSRDPDLSQLFSPEKELRFKGSLKLKLVELQTERVRVRDLPVHIQAVNGVMQANILQALNPSCRYYVCFDQLDLGFSASDEHYRERLTGLIIAARDLFVAARDAGQSLNVVVFLRDDIYQDLQFEDKNKITENFTARVLWKESGTALSLKHLMERRFSEVLTSSGGTLPWEGVFDDSREMPSRQSKYRHICDRTFLRPRDMIKFCNEVLNAYQGRPGDVGELFDNTDIHAARDAYSDYLLNELDDEIAKHVPHYKEYLEVLKSIGSEKFSLSEFAAAWKQRLALDGNPTGALMELFEFSVVAYLKPGGRGGGSEYVWRYKDPRARFDTTSESYRVHPGYKEALDLTQKSGRSVDAAPSG